MNKESLKWLSKLLCYPLLNWDTSGIWVCETHPLMPFEGCETFACKCGGAGRPPIHMPIWVNGFCCSLEKYSYINYVAAKH